MTKFKPNLYVGGSIHDISDVSEVYDYIQEMYSNFINICGSIQIQKGLIALSNLDCFDFEWLVQRNGYELLANSVDTWGRKLFNPSPAHLLGIPVTITPSPSSAVSKEYDIFIYAQMKEGIQ